MHHKLWWNSVFYNQHVKRFSDIFHTITTRDAKGLLESLIIPCFNQISNICHTSPCNCQGIAWRGRYVGTSIVIGMTWVIQSQNPRSSSFNRKTSWLSFITLINLACWFFVNFMFVLNFNLNGSFLTSSWKSKSLVSRLALELNAGHDAVCFWLTFSVSADSTSTCLTALSHILSVELPETQLLCPSNLDPWQNYISKGDPLHHTAW